MEQIFFKGVIEYLTGLVDINYSLATDISSQVDFTNIESIYSLSLFQDDEFVQKKLAEIREIALKYPLTATSFLLGLGIPSNLAEQVLNHYKKLDTGLVTLVRENPYVLLDVEGFSFSRADKIALDYLDVKPESEVRLKALVFYQLAQSCNRSGHLYLDLKDFVSGKFDAEIPKGTVKDYVKKLIQEGKFLLEGNRLYTATNYKSEVESAKIISKLIANRNKIPFFEGINPEQFILGYERIQSENVKNGSWKNIEWKDSKFELSPQQKQVIQTFLKERFIVVTGLPGTGKTSSIKALVDISKSRNLNIALMTPTGISAKRLAEKSGFEASTIHKVLGFDGVLWARGDNNRLDFDVIIIDEFSMVDQLLLYKLLLALPEKDFVLVFVGDAAQLPSVGPGNVLKELIRSGKIPHVQLTEIFRQEDTSDIVINAHLINRGITNLVSSKKDWIFYDTQNEQDILDTIIKFASKMHEKNHNYQILSPTYKGTLGVTNLNIQLQKILNPDRNEKNTFKTDSYNYYVNDKIMIVKNDYKNEVYNGEQGLIKSINLKMKKVSVLIGPKEIEYSFKDAYLFLCLDYARTIYKCQSQEYNYVIMPFVNQFHVQLQRNLLYTAVTRAKKKVYIFGHQDALSKAIKNNNTSKRNTIFSSRIATCVETETKI